MTMQPATLDHVVVNTLRGMDAAADIFAALGFTLTPRGHHSLGSINHLMMTPGPYLELVGVPDAGLQRQDVLNSPFGLNGLVLRSADADATFAQLRAAGFAAAPPASFSRPVAIDGAMVDARFRTVRIPTESFPAGRVYYCEHLTPGYVWRPAWLGHANTFRTIDRLVVASPDPAIEAGRYAKACGGHATREGAGWCIRLGPFCIEIIEGPVPRFLSLGLQFDDLAMVERKARALPGADWQPDAPGTATLTLPALALRLECRTAP